MNDGNARKEPESKKLMGMGRQRVKSNVHLISDHNERLLTAKQEWILINHRLHDVF